MLHTDELLHEDPITGPEHDLSKAVLDPLSLQHTQQRPVSAVRAVAHDEPIFSPDKTHIHANERVPPHNDQVVGRHQVEFPISRAASASQEAGDPPVSDEVLDVD